jgi:hypothetical protein
VAPRTKPQVPELSPEDEERLVHAAQQVVDGETIALTEDETRAYCETGVLPERVERWAASRR